MPSRCAWVTAQRVGVPCCLLLLVLLRSLLLVLLRFFLSLHISAQFSLLRAIVLPSSILARAPPPFFFFFFAFALFCFRSAFCSFTRCCLRHSSRSCCLCIYSVTCLCSRSLISFRPVASCISSFLIGSASRRIPQGSDMSYFCAGTLGSVGKDLQPVFSR
jgi:hypothetical protein